MKSFKEIMNEGTSSVQLDANTFKNITSLMNEFEDEEGITSKDYTIIKKDKTIKFKDIEKSDCFINFVKDNSGKAWSINESVKYQNKPSNGKIEKMKPPTKPNIWGKKDFVWIDDGASPSDRYVVLNKGKFDSRYKSVDAAIKSTAGLGRLTDMAVWDRKEKKIVYEIDAGTVKVEYK